MLRRTDTLIIGAGQAGLSLSYHLRRAGRSHVLLERGRVGERWRSERWDSLALLTPNWLNRLDSGAPHPEPDGFLERDGFVDYLRRYARAVSAPVREQVTVLSVEQARAGFHVRTDAGAWRARNVVVATGDSAVAARPPIAPETPGCVLQSVRSTSFPIRRQRGAHRASR
jgi:putative flavoprotein involved in K+ transport